MSFWQHVLLFLDKFSRTRLILSGLCGLLCIDSSSETDNSELLSEIKMLRQAGRHPNIVHLVGACTKNGKF